MRTDPENPIGSSPNPDQSISLEEAIYGFKQGGAHCLGRGWEDRLESIEADCRQLSAISSR